MTKEEVIEIFERFVIGAKPCSQREIVDACASAYAMLKKQPSLPSNLDEAALKELQVYLPQGNGPDGICYFIAPQMLAMYKAGAELMAGQSQKIDGDLEKEAEAYWKAQGGGSHAQWDKFRAVVKHFTEWQKEQMIKDSEARVPRWKNIDEEKPRQGEDCACITVTVNGHIKYTNFEEGPWYWDDSEGFRGYNNYGDKEYHTCSYWMPWDKFFGVLERQFKK